MSIGEKIRKWRSFRRMTMPQLSEAIGIPASTIYLWEKNRLTPNRQEIGSIAHALGVAVPEIADTANMPLEPSVLPRQEEAAPPQVAERELPEPRQERSEDPFDMILITKMYHYIRDEVESASLVELTTARNLFQESLKIIRERIKELNDYKKAIGRK